MTRIQTITETDRNTGEKIIRPMTIEEIELQSRYKAAEKAIKAGTREPRVGDKLYITTSRGIVTRRRCGLDFEGTVPREVEIVSGEEADVAARVKRNESVCSQLGYFDLVGDDGLVCHRQPLDSVALDALQAQASEAQRLAADNEAMRLALLEQKAAVEQALANAKTIADNAKAIGDSAKAKADSDGARIAELEAALAAAKKSGK